MATLDKIIEMQSQGIPDAEISKRLQNQGIQPKEINDSLNQAKIKSAVSPPEIDQLPQFNPDEMQPSMQDPQMSSIPQIPQYQEQAPQQYQQPQYQDSPQIPQYQEQAPQQEYYPESNQPYSQDSYYPQTPIDSDIITEIAEQVASEKLQEFTKRTGDLLAFKNETLENLKDLNERLKKIEDSIEHLQRSIIGKMGEFSKTTEFIHRDLENVHGTMSKLMNPLVDNFNELKKLAGKK